MPAFRRASLALAFGFATVNARAELTEMATARQLAIQGIDAVENGDCDKGTELLERAEGLHHASVHLQYLARCRVKAGRLVDATEMWRRILREGAPAGASPAIQGAVTEAAAELERTLPRLGATTLTAKEKYADLELILDGRPIPAALVGAAQVMDPGEHELRARAPGFEPWVKKWTLAEGGSEEILVALTAGEGGRDGDPDAEGGPPGVDRKRPSSPLVTAGSITTSVGAAALIGGSVTLLMRNGRKSDLESRCDNRACPNEADTQDPKDFTTAELEDEKGSIEDLTLATNLLLFGGGALVAGGVTLLVIGGNSRTETAVAWGAPAAEAGLTVRGRW